LEVAFGELVGLGTGLGISSSKSISNKPVEDAVSLSSWVSDALRSETDGVGSSSPLPGACANSDDNAGVVVEVGEVDMKVDGTGCKVGVEIATGTGEDVGIREGVGAISREMLASAKSSCTTAGPAIAAGDDASISFVGDEAEAEASAVKISSWTSLVTDVRNKLRLFTKFSISPGKSNEFETNQSELQGGGDVQIDVKLMPQMSFNFQSAEQKKQTHFSGSLNFLTKYIASRQNLSSANPKTRNQKSRYTFN
jgi:hypothetical protein